MSAAAEFAGAAAADGIELRADATFDWLCEQGHVLHEIEWSHGGLWLIECGDVVYRWMPLGSAEAAG